jgi:hypothetical protein
MEPRLLLTAPIENPLIAVETILHNSEPVGAMGKKQPAESLR